MIEALSHFETQAVTSRNTSINGNKLPRAFTVVSEKFGWEPGTVNLDIGGGRYDNATEFLETYGVSNLVFDPYNRSVEHNQKVLEQVSGGGADTVTLSNVLCVISEREIQDKVLRLAHDSLKAFGTVYITLYEGDGSGAGRMTGKDQWQENRKLSDYLKQVKAVFGCAEMRWGMIWAIKEWR